MSTGQSRTNRQSTLTQMDYGPISTAERSFGSRLEIADSEDDDDFEEPREKKRRKIVRTVATITLMKQDTLTQMDFLKRMAMDETDEELRELGILDDANPRAGATTLDASNSSSRIEEDEITAMIPDVIPTSSVEERPIPGQRTIPDSEESTNLERENPAPTASTVLDPSTPRRVRVLEVPSSQTPTATPFSISSISSQRKSNFPETPSPSKQPTRGSSLRTNSPLKALLSSSRSKPSFQDFAAEGRLLDAESPAVPEHAAELSEPEEDLSIDIPCAKINNISPVPTLNERLRRSASKAQMIREHSQKPNGMLPIHEYIDTDTQSQSQSQTQVSQGTKKRVADFNARWLAISKPQIPKVPEPNCDLAAPVASVGTRHNNSQKSRYIMSRETQIALQEIGDYDDDENLSPEKLQLHKSNGHILVPASSVVEAPSHDHGTCNATQHVFTMNQSSHTRYQTKERPRRLVIPASQDDSQDMILETPDEHVALHDSPIRPSQASTAPCTPRSQHISQPRFTGQIPNDVVVISSSPMIPTMSSPLDTKFEVDENNDSLPAYDHAEYGDENAVEADDIKSTRRKQGISQLLPSSIMDSDVPLPPESMDMQF